MSSTEHYSSDDCWDGELARSPPVGRPARRSFEVSRPATSGRMRRSGSGNLDGLDESALFWEKEPEGHQKYEVVKCIGKGQYGTVVSARHRRTGKTCAIKHIGAVFLAKDYAIKTLRELRFLRVFHHPNVVGLHDVLVPRNAQTFDDVFLVTELMETDLDKLIKSKTVLHDRHNRWIMYQLLRALAYVHGANVSHRDVKPANIVLDSQCNLKLCDFGLSRADFPRESETPIFWTDYVATRWYRAPELICSHYEQYTTQIDVWAAGCIMGELVKRRPLFPGRNVYHQIDLITNFCGTPTQSTIDQMRNQKAREHLMRQVPPKPHEDSASKFPSLGEEGLSMLHGLLSFDPRARSSAATSLQHSFFKEIRQSIDESFIQPPPQMAEVDFAWEDEDQNTTAELRRKLYDEILGFHPEALARGIALAAAKKAASEDLAPAEGPRVASEQSSAASPRPESTAMAPEEGASPAATRDSDSTSKALEGTASCGGASAEMPSSEIGPGDPDDETIGEWFVELGEHLLQPLAPTGSREEQWGHLRMGNGTSEASTDCDHSSTDCDYSEDGEHGAGTGGRRPLQRRPSMCSLTSGSENSEPISYVSDHVWSSHECHNHHTFHEEPALPKFTEETEEMKVCLDADSPGGRSDSTDSCTYTPGSYGEDLAGKRPSAEASPLELVLTGALSDSPGRPHAGTPQHSGSSTAHIVSTDLDSIPTAQSMEDAVLDYGGCTGEDAAVLQREFKAAYHNDDKFVDMSLRAHKPSQLGSSQRTMSADVPDDIALPLQLQKENDRSAKTTRKSRAGGGGLMSCCGSSTR